MLKKSKKEKSLEKIADIPVDNLVVEVKLKSDRPVSLREYTIDKPFVIEEGKRVNVKVNDVVLLDDGCSLVLRVDKGILVVQNYHVHDSIMERAYNLNDSIFISFLYLATSPVIYRKGSNEYQSRKNAMKDAFNF
jgi:hypothetical protein